MDHAKLCASSCAPGDTIGANPMELSSTPAAAVVSSSGALHAALAAGDGDVLRGASPTRVDAAAAAAPARCREPGATHGDALASIMHASPPCTVPQQCGDMLCGSGAARFHWRERQTGCSHGTNTKTALMLVHSALMLLQTVPPEIVAAAPRLQHSCLQDQQDPCSGSLNRTESVDGSERHRTPSEPLQASFHVE